MDNKEKIEYIHYVLGVPYSVIADCMGVSQSLITKYAKGNRNLSLINEYRLSAYIQKFKEGVEIL